jgi:hypothetical protein
MGVAWIDLPLLARFDPAPHLPHYKVYYPASFTAYTAYDLIDI